MSLAVKDRESSLERGALAQRGECVLSLVENSGRGIGFVLAEEFRKNDGSLELFGVHYFRFGDERVSVRYDGITFERQNRIYVAKTDGGMFLPRDSIKPYAVVPVTREEHLDLENDLSSATVRGLGFFSYFYGIRNAARFLSRNGEVKSVIPWFPFAMPLIQTF